MRILLVYNATAGSGSHSGEALQHQLINAGHHVVLVNAPDEFSENFDLVIAAGGDGTVGKVLRYCCASATSRDLAPIGIIPLGTANNIARSLDVAGSYALQPPTATTISTSKSLSVGSLSGYKDGRFFAESVGCGLLAKLFQEEKPDSDMPQDAIARRQEQLLEILSNYEPRYCQLIIDGQDYSGHYLLVEVMNITHVGPSLELAPDLDPGGDLFQVVLIGSNEREALSEYVAALLRNEPVKSPFWRVPAQQVELICPDGEAHVDDKCLADSLLPKNEQQRLKVQAGAHCVRVID